MTITKAIAMAALAGTLLAGPSLAIAQPTEHGNSATAHQNNDTRKAEHEASKATQQSGQDQQDDQATEDDASGTTNGKALGKPNFGTLVSSLHHDAGTLTSTDLSNLTTGFTVSQVDLTAYGSGKMHAIDNALSNVNATDVQTTLTANADVTAALQANNIDVSTVAYAYVDAGGNLVVYTR